MKRSNVGSCLVLVVALAASPAARAAGTLTVQTTGADKGVAMAVAIDEQKAFAYGAKDDGQGNNAPVMLFTSDGGDSWDLQPAQGVTSAAMLLLMDSVCTATKCYALAGSIDQGTMDIRLCNFVTSTDGGRSWFWPAKTQLASRSYSRIDMVSSSDFWLSNGDTTIRHSTDGGKTWVFRTPTVNDLKYMSIADTSFLDAQTGYVVNSKVTKDEQTGAETISPEGALLKTTDGATTWTTLFTDRAEAYDQIQMLSASAGWLVGHTAAGPFLRRTTDGGQTWDDVAIPASSASVSGSPVPAIQTIDSFRMLDAGHGLLIGNAKVGDDQYVHVIYEIRNGVPAEVASDPLGNAGFVGGLSCTASATCWMGASGSSILKYVDSSVVPPADSTPGDDTGTVADRGGDEAAQDVIGTDLAKQDATGGSETSGGGSSGCSAAAIPAAASLVPALLGLLALVAVRGRRRED